MLGKAVRRVLKLLRVGKEKAVLMLLRLQYGSQGFPLDMRIGPGVRVSITDGGAACFGRHCSVNQHVTIVAKHGRLNVGSDVYIGPGAVIAAGESIVIGNDVLIAEYVTIRDQDHGYRIDSPTRLARVVTAPISIGNNVWLGAKVTVTKGVTIGSNTVVGANSVVTRDLPPDVLAAGAPARVIRSLRRGEAIPEMEATLP